MAAAPVDWAPPPRRGGVAGFVDVLLGPGATAAEAAVALLPAAAAAAVIVDAGATRYGWTGVQTALGGFLAFDIVGGAVANATTPAKRYYHGRPGATGGTRLAFVAAHGVHVAAVAAAWGGGRGGRLSPAAAAGVYGALLAAAAAVVGVPRRLQRPVAVVAVVAAVLVATTEGGPAQMPRGMGWFLPTLALKLLVGHLVTEEPYVGEPPEGAGGGAGGKDE